MKQIKAPCSTCKGRTNHDILHNEDVRHSGEDYHFGVEYRIIRCRGCDGISFQQMSWDADYHDEHYNPIEDYKHFPFPENGRDPVADYYFIPRIVRNIYLETLKARNNELLILAGIGVRAVVEALCIDKGCKIGNLEKSIDALKDAGVLTADQAGYLHLNRFLGNEAAHEVNEVPLKEIDAALDIIDAVITMTYKLPDYAERLEQYKKPPKPTTGTTSSPAPSP